MAFGADERGVSAVVGATLLFGFLVVFLAVYQASVVPNQNEQVEFDHSQGVQRDLVDGRNAILDAAETGEAGFVSVTLGTTYPPRVIAVNPPPVTGTLRTTANRSFAVRAGGDDVTGDVCPGDADTRLLVYEPSYHAYSDGPDVVYEHSVVYEQFGTGNVTLSGQSLVRGDTVDLVPLQRPYSESGIGTVSFEPRAGGLDTTEVEDPEIELPTRLGQSDWEELLDGQVDPANVTVADGNVTVSLDGEYTVNCRPVGVGDAPPSGERGGDGGGDGGGDINPAGPGDVRLEGARTGNNDSVVGVDFNNTADLPTNVTEAKLNFYFDAQQTGGEDHETVDLRNHSTGTELLTDLEIGGNREPLTTEATLPSQRVTTLRFEFDGQGNVGVRDGDFFIVELTFTDGTSGTYFVAPQS